MRTELRLALREYLKKRTGDLLPRVPLQVSSKRSFLPSEAIPPTISVTTGREHVDVLVDSPRSYRRSLEVTVMGVLVAPHGSELRGELEELVEQFGARLERVMSEFALQTRLPLVDWRLLETDLDTAVRSSVDMGAFELLYRAEWDSDEAAYPASGLDDFARMELRHAS